MEFNQMAFRLHLKIHYFVALWDCDLIGVYLEVFVKTVLSSVYSFIFLGLWFSNASYAVMIV